MPQYHKIEKLNLCDRVLALKGQGKSDREVSRILNEEAAGEYIVSPATVSRWVKKVRVERAEKTREVYDKHIEATLPNDLLSLEELQQQFRAIAMPDKVEAEIGQEGAVQRHEFRDRLAAADRVIKIIDTKLKYAGLLEDPEAAGLSPSDPVDLNQFRKEMQEGKEDIRGRL